MNALVVFDTKWGNTEAVANAVAKGIGKGASAVRIGQAAGVDLHGVDLLVIGSPVIGGKATKPLQEFLKQLEVSSGSRFRVATFDTRMTMKFAQKFGHAAVKMADELKAKGAELVGEPVGFIVQGQKGPLAEGEADRAVTWGKKLAGMR